MRPCTQTSSSSARAAARQRCDSLCSSNDCAFSRSVYILCVCACVRACVRAFCHVSGCHARPCCVASHCAASPSAGLCPIAHGYIDTVYENECAAWRMLHTAYTTFLAWSSSLSATARLLSDSPMQTSVHACVFVSLHECECACVRACKRACMCACVRACGCACMCACVQTDLASAVPPYVQAPPAHTHVHAHANRHAVRQAPQHCKAVFEILRPGQFHVDRRVVIVSRQQNPMCEGSVSDRCAIGNAR